MRISTTESQREISRTAGDSLDHLSAARHGEFRRLLYLPAAETGAPPRGPLRRPTRGRIVIDGTDIHDVACRAIATLAGVSRLLAVFQHIRRRTSSFSASRSAQAQRGALGARGGLPSSSASGTPARAYPQQLSRWMRRTLRSARRARNRAARAFALDSRSRRSTRRCACIGARRFAAFSSSWASPRVTSHTQEERSPAPTMSPYMYRAGSSRSSRPPNVQQAGDAVLRRFIGTMHRSSEPSSIRRNEPSTTAESSDRSMPLATSAREKVLVLVRPETVSSPLLKAPSDRHAQPARC